MINFCLNSDREKTKRFQKFCTKVYTMNLINPLYTGGLFHCYMLDESIYQFMGVGSILSLLFYL